MKNKILRKRIGACLLGASLFLSSGGVGGLCEQYAFAQEETTEITAEDQNVKLQDTEVSTPKETAPEESVPETSAQDIPVQETASPDLESKQGTDDAAVGSEDTEQNPDETQNQPETVAAIVGLGESGSAIKDQNFAKPQDSSNGTTDTASETTTESATETTTETATETIAEQAELTARQISDFASEEANVNETEDLAELQTEEMERISEAETEEIDRMYRVFTRNDELVSYEFEQKDQTFSPGDVVSVTVRSASGYSVEDVSAMVTLSQAPEGEIPDDNEIIVTNEEVSAVVETAAPEYEIEESEDGETQIDLPSGLSSEKEIVFVMPESDVTVLATTMMAAEEDIRSIKLNTDASLGKAYGPDQLKNSGTQLYIDKFEVTIKTEDGDTEVRSAHCLQPAVSNPSSGTYTEGSGSDHFTVLDEDGSGKNALIARALYYMYQGPAWGKTIDDINLQSILKKYGCTSGGNYYCMTHYLLAYLYNGNESNWDAWFDPNSGKKTGLFNATGKNCIRELAEALEKLPAPVTEFSKTTLNSAPAEGGVSASESVTFHSFEENVGTIVLPAGVTLVTESGARYTGTCKINGGTTFHLEKKCTAKETTTITLTAKYGTDFTAMRLQQSGKQDVAFAYYSGGSLELNVNWEVSGIKIKINKLDAVTGSGVTCAPYYSLAGARYTLYSDSACTNVLEVLTTGEDGTAVSANEYGVGCYYVKETIAPTCGLYEMSASVGTIIVSADNVIGNEMPAASDSDNPKQIRIRIQKTDRETGASVPQTTGLSFAGAVFGIYKDAGCQDLIETVTTDESGAAVSSSFFVNDYWIKELSAPEGYLINENIISVSGDSLSSDVRQNLTEREITVEEQIIRGNISFMKTLRDSHGDQIEDERRKGIEFTFTYTADPTVTFTLLEGKNNTIVTDADGYATTVDTARYPLGTLIYGEWEIRETNAPEGMALGKPIKVFIDTNGKIMRYVIDNDQIETRLLIEKRDENTGALIPVANVVFQIIKADGTVLSMFDPSRKAYCDTWETDESGCVYLPDTLPFGNYTLKEVDGIPREYTVMADLEFSVTEMNKDVLNPMVITAKEPPLQIPVRITKRDADTDTPMEGVVFTVRVVNDICDLAGNVRTGRDAEGKEVSLTAGTIVQRITTDSEGIATSDPLYLGSYSIEEIETIFGYAITDAAREVTVDPDRKTGDIIDGGEFLNHETKIRIKKIDADTKEPLAGVTFLVSKADTQENEGKEIVTGTDGMADLTGFEKDTDYVVRETQTLPGHILCEEEIKFHVDEKGLIGGSYIFESVVTNNSIQVSFSKTDITETKEIPGATLTIRDETGEVVETWISEEKPHIVRALVPGNYTLTEELPPAGYVTAETVSFTVEDTGEVQKVVMKDDVTKVEISKSDVTTSKPVEGAVLVIKDESGNEICRWITEKTPHYIEMLPIGKYTLTEITAPEGYEIAETITFEVSDTAKIQKVAMFDAPEKKTKKKTKKKTEKQSEKQTAETNKNSDSGVPRTGDNTPIAELMLILAAAGLFIRFILKKRFCSGK